ncbi:MAG: hypothetical protein GY953_38555 [bacterium]|nr:hypothetical protein [bacterium]
MRILAVPNDDGFGPSALLSYVVKELLRLEPHCRVTVWNHFAYRFNCLIYGGDPRVDVADVWNLVQLARPRGDVSIEATLELMGGYAGRSKRYQERAQTAFDLVVDFGAPAAARWARDRGIPSVTVFDHCWSKTLEMILADQREVAPSLRRRWRTLIRQIEADESCADRVLLFPRPVTPSTFVDHWPIAEVCPGVLRQRASLNREAARRLLGLVRPGATMLVQGGGTPVWNAPMETLARQLREAAGRRRLARRELNLVLYSPGLGEIDYTRVKRLRPVPGGTTQTVLSAIDSAMLRAGGGSVNDAVAHRLPFVCVREPAQSQIEGILGDCEALRLTRAVPIEAFRDDPLGTLLAEQRWLSDNSATLHRRMRHIPSNGARWMARQLLASVR